MKAISLWQPWASAMALGSKRIETRHWATSYRGTLAIHAAKRFVQKEQEGNRVSPVWMGALWGAKILMNLEKAQSLHYLSLHRLPFGAMGDYTPGRFGWVFENIRPLKAPVLFKGKQGFFNVPDDLILF